MTISEIVARVEQRYRHLLKAYGEHSEHVQGFRDCMRIVTDAEKEHWKGKTNYHRIKAMNAGELAEAIADLIDQRLPKECVEDWLLSEDIEE